MRLRTIAAAASPLVPRRLLRAALGLALASVASELAAAPASAQERQEHGPFYVLESDPTTIYLDGPLNFGSAQALFEALPQLAAETLVLNSQNGTLIDTMVVAELVAERRLNTFVPEGASCLGVCFFVALAGWERVVEGELAMTRWIDPATATYIDPGKMFDLQIDALRRYGAPVELLDLFAVLPAEIDFFFGAVELEDFRIARSAVEAEAHFDAAPLSQVLPEPLIPREIEAVGNDVVGVIDVTRPVGEPQVRPTAVRWGVAEPGEPAGLLSAHTTIAPKLSVLIGYGSGAVDGVTRFGVAFEVAVIYPIEWQRIEQVLTFGGADDPGNPTFLFFLVKEAPVRSQPGDPDQSGERYELLIPTIYRAAAQEMLAEQNRLYIYMVFTDGTELNVLSPVTAEARAAFDEALAAD